ncbi:MAG: hypothetical protein ACRDF9_02805 [Candidatus Limnocylindria bacterium]|jgi:hypothetical protein
MSANEAGTTADATGHDASSEAEQRVGESVALAMHLVGPPDAGSARNLE